MTDNAYGVSREEFVDALIAEGLIEVDIPGSTALLNDLPLFHTPNEIMPRLYKTSLSKQSGFPRAEEFYKTIIKLPVWAFKDEQSIVEAYIEGIQKVSNYLIKNRSLKRPKSNAR